MTKLLTFELAMQDNQRMALAKSLTEMRPARWPLDVAFYDAASAQVWG